MKIESVNSNRKTLSDSGEMRNSQGLKAGQTLHNGTYRIERVLGQGSFGITYLAKARVTTHGNLGEMNVEAQVAIKEFFMSEVNSRRADGSTVEGSMGSVFTNYRKKFKKEAENLAKLSHPNIVKVFDVFDENSTTYYVMEFLEGDNLDDYIKQQGHLTEQEAIDVIGAVGSALDYMHSQKMLHLDIKPKNIMHRTDGRNYLIDFGLSKQFTDAGEPESSTSIGLGTPGYSPIEQASYKQDGTFPATLDVYALGATMFKMLTGKRPPEATNILNEGFPTEELTQCGVSRQTAAAVKRAMEPMKKKRYKNVRTFLNELDEGTVLGPKSKPKPSSKPKQKTEVVHLPKPNKNWNIFAIVVTIIVLAVYLYDIFYLDEISTNTEELVQIGDEEYNRENYNDAINNYRLAAEQGSAHAQFNLGIMYSWGQGVEQNLTEAVKWYRKAAEQGDADAQNNLGFMYNTGQGVEQNYTEAVKWYRKAAKQGNADAQNNLGIMYNYGRGVEQNYTEALKWYRKAAEQGNADAQNNLGYMYNNGQGVEQNYTEALKWYRKAAEQGNANAQINLGIRYLYGEGVVKNKKEAVKWLTLAAEQGDPFAKELLKDLK